MNFESFAESRLVVSLGWTLFHSLWQLGLVTIALLLVLRALHAYSAHARYVVSVAALAITLLVPVLTFVQVSSQHQDTLGGTRTGRQDSSDQALRLTRPGEAIPIPAIADAVPARGSVQFALFSSLSEFVTPYLRNFSPIAVVIWLLGIAIFSLRLGGGFGQLYRYKNEGSGKVDDRWTRAFSDLCDRTGVQRKVELLRSTVVQTPIAIGTFKPIVLVPASLFLQMSPRELETIIAHELVHIRRYDPLINLVQCAVEAIFFYHPGVWCISAQIRREREFAADAAVTEVFEDSHVTYARALANLEEIRLSTDKHMPRYATAANGGNFMQRIQRILNIKTEASTANSAWTAGLAISLTSVFLLAVLCFTSSEVVNGQHKAGGRRLAVGFVSIPPVDRTANAPKDSDATARLLIQELKEHKVPAIGFIQGGMISDGEKLFPVRANIARMWIEAGFEVGLGGFRHIALYDTPADDYIANIEKNERAAKLLVGETGLTARYFSYPFLNTGKAKEDKAKVEAWLESRGYTSVKYTFDNQEWMYSFAYDMARNDNDVNTMKEIREAYLGYMGRMFDHYEAYSAEMFGRDIPQTLVLTPSRLITDTADEFFGMAAKRGYTFIPLDEAQNDPAYKTREDFTGEAGISWFERWTMAKGGRLRSEPAVDKNVEKIWNERKHAAKK